MVSKIAKSEKSNGKTYNTSQFNKSKNSEY